MTIQITSGPRAGSLFDGAHWLGFNFWCRVWVTEPNGSGWLHFPSSEFRVVSER